MSNRILGRLLGATVSAALLLGLLVTPAAGASTSRWVDDDLTAGDGPAQCDSAAYSSIQTAISASSAGDWVYVCPGTYTEALNIPAGVKVRARPLRQAILVAPSNGLGTLVTLSGDGARVRGLRIRVNTIGCVVLAVSCPVSASLRTPSPGCAHYDTAILALGNNEEIRDNYIEAVGDATLSGPCGFDYGIVVGNHGDSATARVTFNWVVNFKVGGILVEDTDSYAFVRRNTLRFFHENECPVATITICVITTVKPSVNNAFTLAFGIGVESSARADIIKNWVGSGAAACSTGPSYSCPADSTPTLNDGISMTGLDSSETTTVRDNTVTKTTAGIVTRVAADGAVIHDNSVSYSHYSFWALGDNDEWHDNHTLGGDYGMYASGSGNNIHDNNFRGNAATDCYDGSTGSGTQNTANTWTNDLGNSDSPDGICIPDAP